MAREASDALTAAQQSDGGWRAADGEPSAPDVTGLVLEALRACGQAEDARCVRRGARFLEESQHAEAWWRGARGICRTYGTAMALRGLRVAGCDDREAAVLRAGEWLRSVQNADGGWGEDPKSHEDGEFRGAASTPEQTAWALLDCWRAAIRRARACGAASPGWRRISAPTAAGTSTRRRSPGSPMRRIWPIRWARPRGR